MASGSRWRRGQGDNAGRQVRAAPGEHAREQPAPAVPDDGDRTAVVQRRPLEPLGQPRDRGL
jgi:hypothetical protein